MISPGLNLPAKLGCQLVMTSYLCELKFLDELEPGYVWLCTVSLLWTLHMQILR